MPRSVRSYGFRLNELRVLVQGYSSGTKEQLTEDGLPYPFTASSADLNGGLFILPIAGQLS